MSQRPGGTGVKGLHHGKRPWNTKEVANLRRLKTAGESDAECARQLGRTFTSVQLKVQALRNAGALERPMLRSDGKRNAARPLDATIAQIANGERSWSVKDSGAAAELAQTVFEPVRTLDDLLTICEVDSEVWEVVAFTCNAWGGGTSQEPRTLYQVKAQLRRREAIDIAVKVQALIDGAIQARAPIRHARRIQSQKQAQLVIIADPHFGKLCWSRGTGSADYDVDIAYRTLLQGAEHLLAACPRVERRYIVSLGDFFHFDTLGGTTTGGTVVDRDSRIPKILEVGADALARIVRLSAARTETELVIVPGNHDEVLSAALQRIMVAEFRGSTVTVDDTHTRRKARSYGRNLLGFNHGDKRKKELCSALAIENAVAWGDSTYREIHTGHLHSEGERYEGTITHAGVTLRTHRSLTPPDQWHSDSGFIDSSRGMSAWLYDARGGLLGMHMFSPDLERAA